MTSKTCLRCDWQGETKEPTCPNCGQHPLYASVAPVRRPAPPVEPPPSRTDAVEPSGRSARSAVAFVVAALVLTITLGTWLKAHEERSAPAGPPDAAAQETPASDGSSTPIVSSGPGSLVRIDATTGEIVARVPMSFPTELAADGRSIWVFAHGGSAGEKLVRVEATMNAVAETFDVAGLALSGLAVAGGRAWVGDGPIYRLAPGASALGPRAAEYADFGLPGGELPNISSRAFAAEGSLWVSWSPPGPCCPHPADLHRIDPTTLEVIARIDEVAGVVASGDGFLWAQASTKGQGAPRLVRIDTETYATVPIGALGFLWADLTGTDGAEWADLTGTDGAVWASSPEDDTIVRLDPTTGEEIERIRVGGEPGALAVGAGAVWAAISDNGTVVRYDVEADLIETIDVGGTPNDLVFANGSVWVAVYDGSPTEAQPGPFLLDLRTGEATPLAENLGAGHSYAASPDGTRFAYVGAGDHGDHQIFIADIDGTEVRQMTHDLTSPNWPAWSPDGTMISYEGFDYGSGIFVIDVATGGSTQITDEGGNHGGPYQFTPDSSSLLIPGGSSGSWVLRTLPVSGDKAMILTGPHRGLFDVGNVSLSPDGSLVTFLASEGPHGPGPRRYVADSDGTDQRHIPGYISDLAGTWSPDGSRIVCSNGNGIIVVDIATGDASPVAEGRRAIWLDDHTLLVEA